MTEGLALALNQEFNKRELPIQITYFGSLWRIKFTEELQYSELLFVLMREKGIHIWDGFPCFVTNAYLEEDIQQVKTEVLSSIDELLATGFLRNTSSSVVANTQVNKQKTVVQLNTPPVPGAKLGRDKDGNPAWFIADKQKEGAYIQIDL